MNLLGFLLRLALGSLGWLWDRALRFLRWAKANPEPAAIVLLLIGLGFALWQLAGVADQRDALRDQVKRIEAAQGQAEKEQRQVLHAPVLVSTAIAKDSRAHEKALYDAGRAAGAAYADAHRVRGSASSASQAALSGADRAPRVDDRAGGPPQLADWQVVITRDDFDRCTDNSTRLFQVHADAQRLIREGLAVELKPEAGR